MAESVPRMCERARCRRAFFGFRILLMSHVVSGKAAFFRIAALITLWLRVGRMTCHFATDVTAVTPDDRVRTMCVNARSYGSCEFGSAVSVRFGSVVRRPSSREVHSPRPCGTACAQFTNSVSSIAVQHGVTGKRTK